MRWLRISSEVVAIGLICWLSVASSDDEQPAAESPPAEGGGNGQPGTPTTSCSTDADCPGSDATDKCSGHNKCVAGQCVYQGGVECTNMPGQGPCAAASCDPSTGACILTQSPDGTGCDDSNNCTNGDQCKSGICASGSPTNCDDGQPCSIDSCNPQSGCTHQYKDVGTPCSSGENKCYGPGTCSGYADCTPGAPVACDDGNSCTEDYCDPATGCVNSPFVGQGCDDGNPCTKNDNCAAAGCVGEPLGDGDACEDGNPCTGASTCTGGACGGGIPVGDGGACDDNNPCTNETTCGGGQCAGGTPVECPDDGNPCSEDFCDPAVGCTVKPMPPETECPSPNDCYELATCSGLECAGGILKANGTLCDDGVACTGGSTCQNGVCTGGTSLGEGAVCDDGNPCTSGEKCQSGTCLSVEQGACDDLDPCTVDSCDPDSGECTHSPLCGGDACNYSICQGGDCIPQVTECDDDNPCTTDYCDGVSGCQNVPLGDGQPCPDDDGCLVQAQCKAGQCEGTPKCDDAEPCTTDSCLGGVCTNEWQESEECPLEGSCENQIDDDGDGLMDCASPSCQQMFLDVCSATNPIPASLTFDDGFAPGFGASPVLAGSTSWAIDASPAEPAPYSGSATLNLNDGAATGLASGAPATVFEARFCCWDNGFAGVELYITWMEWVDLPTSDEITFADGELMRGFSIVRDSGGTTDFPLTIALEDRGKWVRRTVTNLASDELGGFGVRWWLSSPGEAWTGGAGWFIDDVQILLGEDCGNGGDDNGNGAVDCADPLCEDFPQCHESDCTNSIDDDGDGQADCDDPDCAGAPSCP